MKNNKTKYMIFFYNILVKLYLNKNTDDLEYIQVSIVDRHYEEYTDLKSVTNRSRQFKTYKQAINKHCNGWCIASIVDTHGKQITLPKEKLIERYHSPVKRRGKYFKRIRYKSWNKECSRANDLKREMYEDYSINIKVRNCPIDNWENPRSNHSKSWKSKKIIKQYERNK